MDHSYGYDYPKPPLTKALLTGLFVGIIDTIVCLIFNIIYRDSTGFAPQDFINVSSLIFAINLLFLILGAVYFIFGRLFKKADVIFMVVFALLTIFCIWQTEIGHRFGNSPMTSQFHGLMLGILIFSGIAAVFFIPYLYHSEKFEREVI